MVGVVGVHGQLTQSTIWRNPKTKYKRWKTVFSVTSIALSCVHIRAQLLQPYLQSLIRSPSTLLECLSMTVNTNTHTNKATHTQPALPPVFSIFSSSISCPRVSSCSFHPPPIPAYASCVTSLSSSSPSSSRTMFCPMSFLS